MTPDQSSDQRAGYRLAQQVVIVLTMQRDYLRTRNPDQLAKYKSEERKLKTMADEILHPTPPKPPGLFGPAPEGIPD